VFQVNDVHINTRDVPGPITMFPRHKPVLTQSRKSSDPIDCENAGHGPSALTSEVKTQFIEKEFRKNSMSLNAVHDSVIFFWLKNIIMIFYSQIIDSKPPDFRILGRVLVVVLSRNVRRFAINYLDDIIEIS